MKSALRWVAAFAWACPLARATAQHPDLRFASLKAFPLEELVARVGTAVARPAQGESTGGGHNLLEAQHREPVTTNRLNEWDRRSGMKITWR